jgi:hypothetical protein
MIVANEFVMILGMIISKLQERDLGNCLYFFVLSNQIHLCEEILQRNTLESKLSWLNQKGADSF